MADWRQLVPVVALLVCGVCANGPPPDGTEGTLGAGQGRFSFGSCGTKYFYRESVVHAGVRAGNGTGFSQSLDGSLYEQELVRTEPPNSTGQPEREAGGLLAVRFGYHGRYVGGEIGPGMWVMLPDDALTQIVPVPSANVWAGTRNIYGWAKLLDGAFSNADPAIGVGLGGEIFGARIRAGIGLNGPVAEASVPVNEKTRLGADVCYASVDDWRAVARITLLSK